MELVAVVLVRGHIDLNNDVKDTLNMLKLFRKNYCVVLEKTSPNMGMVQKVKDVITWGEIDEKTLKILIEKRAEKNPKDSTKNKKFFRLQPPRKGFGRKGIKQPFNKGGALGYRGEKINDLIQRML
ncbi:MAG: uL30 family ribosomal protein [Nanoarchaeota archaeon]|nr:uL30 family ribosomal protein [Nanoarchaeota archaeon]